MLLKIITKQIVSLLWYKFSRVFGPSRKFFLSAFKSFVPILGQLSPALLPFFFGSPLLSYPILQALIFHYSCCSHFIIYLFLLLSSFFTYFLSLAPNSPWSKGILSFIPIWFFAFIFLTSGWDEIYHI